MPRVLAAALLSGSLLWPTASRAVCTQSQFKPTCAPCGTLFCNADAWDCTILPETTSCSDGNACTTGDHCNGISAGPGSCVGTPVVCPSDQCNNPGSCNTSTGVCSPMVPKSPPPSCNDGDACTYNDTCVNGACAGTHVTCPSNTACASYSCNGTSMCPPSYSSVSTICNDGNACTGATGTPDHCDGAGNCLAGTATACTASDQCHVAGTCNTSTGSCSNPNAPNGTPCTSDPNGTGAACSSGTCGPPAQCNAGYALCSGSCISSGMQCCTNADCHLASGQGELTCNAAHQCASPLICASGYTACGSICIPQGACCSSADCPSGFSCSANACSLTCASGYQACGTTCIQTGAQVCCPDDNI